MEEKENIVLYDWLSFTSKNHTPEQLIEALGLTHCPWQDTLKIYAQAKSAEKRTESAKQINEVFPSDPTT